MLVFQRNLIIVESNSYSGNTEAWLKGRSNLGSQLGHLACDWSQPPVNPVGPCVSLIKWVDEIALTFLKVKIMKLQRTVQIEGNY